MRTGVEHCPIAEEESHIRGLPRPGSFISELQNVAQLVWLAAPPMTHVKLDAMVTSPLPLYRGHDG
jgi:hypothetical protein